MLSGQSYHFPHSAKALPGVIRKGYHTMKKLSVWRIFIAAVVYFVLCLLGSTSGLLGPVCFAYVGTVLPLFFSFVYLYTAANMQCFGAAAVLNIFVLVIGLLWGEGDPPLIIGLIVFAAIAELVRKINGYSTMKGVRLSFIPLAYSFYAYSAHWWTDTAGSLAAAREEMPAGYADKMVPVIGNIPVLIFMLVLVIPVAMLGMRLAEKAMKKQTALLR